MLALPLVVALALALPAMMLTLALVAVPPRCGGSCLLLPVGFESTGFESTGFERVRRGLAGLASVGFVSTGESVLVTGS